MKNGFMSKALSGLGTGLAIAGELGYRAKLQGDLQAQRDEIMAKRDEVLQGFENQRNASTIAGQKEIHAADRASMKETSAATNVAHLKGIEMQLGAKDTKPVVVDGVAYIRNEGKDPIVVGDKTYGTGELVPATKKGEKWVANADMGVLVEEGTGRTKQVGDGAGGAKNEEATMKRLTMLKDLAKSRMGVDFFQKLNDDERAQFDSIFIEAARSSRTTPNIEDAYESAIKKWENTKKRSAIKGDSGGNSKAQSFREKYGY